MIVELAGKDFPHLVAKDDVFLLQREESSSTTALSSTPSASSTLGTDSAATPSTVAVSSTSSASSVTSTPAPSSTTLPASGSTVWSASIGTIAGASVGCLAGGLFIGFLAAWFLHRRHNSRLSVIEESQAQNIPSYDVSHGVDPKLPLSVTGTNSVDNRDVKLEQYLLDGAPDSEISAELLSLSDLINQHVESHYISSPVQADSNRLSRQLQALGFVQSMDHSPDTLTALCLNPNTRQTGLKHVLSAVVFRSIDFHSQSPLSMLPAPVATFLQSMAALDRGNTNMQQATTLALSEWRRLFAFLLHPDPSQRTSLPVSDAVVSKQALVLADTLNMFLHNFVASSDRQGQTEHLQGVIQECTKLGYALLSHPNDWQFVYAADSKGMVVVCAGLEKLSQRDGTPYKTPKRIVAPTIVPSGGAI